MTALRITQRDYVTLRAHLFQPDRDEHGAILLAGLHRRRGELVLLVRELHLLDGDDFRPGQHGYREFAPAALARLGTRADSEGLSLVCCHSHPTATTKVSLSADDLDGHRRVFPHLIDIVGGRPVAGIAFGSDSAVGEVWHPDGHIGPLARVEVTGPPARMLTARPDLRIDPVDERYDRQARMFGSTGQRVLRAMTVGVVGLGGGGSLVVEQLAHLGVGRIIGIDFDTVEPHNLSRIVGATATDARRRRTKVSVAARLVERIDQTVRFTGVEGDIADAGTASMLLDCDFLFLATDTITSRLIANAIVHSHLIPMVQLGAKVDLREDGQLESVYAAVRPVFPHRGCLSCAGLIDAAMLQREAATDEERAAQNYIGLLDIIDPSVITLNGIGASAAVNVMLMSTVGLGREELAAHRIFDAQHGDWLTLQPQRDSACFWCGTGDRSRFARDDAAHLPVKSPSGTSP
jgi:ThiF family